MNCCNEYGQCKGGKGCPVGEPLPIDMLDAALAEQPAEQEPGNWIVYNSGAEWCAFCVVDQSNSPKTPQPAALAEQEPVAWWHRKSNTFTSGNLVSNFAEWTPLYTSPQPAKPAEQQPVAWEWRWFDTSPYTVTSGQWSEWKRVEPRNSLCTLDDALNEFRAYIANGLRYELRAIYTEPQPKREPLTDEEIDNTTRKQVDDLLDHIYEYGTAAEGIDYRVRAIARAIERAHGIGEQA